MEAGNVFGPLSIVPLLTTLQQNTSVDWAFRTVSQEWSSKGFVNQQQFLPRGKGLGGSSQLNYNLHYGDDFRTEFHKWEKYGGPEWGYGNMMKYVAEDEIPCGDDFGKSEKSCTAKPNQVVNYPIFSWRKPDTSLVAGTCRTGSDFNNRM